MTIKAACAITLTAALLLCGCSTEAAQTQSASAETSPAAEAEAIQATDVPEITEYTFSESGSASIDAINEILSANPAVKTIYLSDPGFSVYDNAHGLSDIRDKTGVTFVFEEDLNGSKVTNDSAELTLAAFPDDPDALRSFLSLTQVTTLSLDGISTIDEVKSLNEQFPELTLNWETTLYDRSITPGTESLDFNDVELTGLDEFYAILPYLKNLSSLEMCGCGISNEDMDALRTAFPNAGIVWSIQTEHWTVRTDATYFATWRIVSRDDAGHITEAYGINFNTNEDLDWLQYCHDMVALDVGHNRLKNIEFVRNMPNLEYLIIAENQVTDLSPVAGLSKLHYLEIFTNPISDLSPLSGLSNLTDLNMCGCYVEDLSQLDSVPLERLWLTTYTMKEKDSVVKSKFLETHPNCDIEIIYDHQYTEQGWRGCDKYWDMRAALGRHDPRKED